MYPQIISSTSSTERLLSELLEAFQEYDPHGDIVRVADLIIKAGVSSDEGDGDEWPGLRKRILAADVLVIGSPIWLGQLSSIAKRVLERMDAFLDERDEMQRMPSYGKVGFATVPAPMATTSAGSWRPLTADLRRHWGLSAHSDPALKRLLRRRTIRLSANGRRLTRLTAHIRTAMP